MRNPQKTSKRITPKQKNKTAVGKVPATESVTSFAKPALLDEVNASLLEVEDALRLLRVGAKRLEAVRAATLGSEKPNLPKPSAELGRNRRSTRFDFIEFDLEKPSSETTELLSRRQSLLSERAAAIELEEPPGSAYSGSDEQTIRNMLAHSSERPTTLFRRDVMRVQVDGSWMVGDFRQLLEVVENLHDVTYGLLFVTGAFRSASPKLRKLDAITKSMVLELPGSLVPFDQRLIIDAVHFSSPGFTDFAGLGEVVKHLKDLILHAIDAALSREQRKQENIERRLRNQQLQIENLRSLVQLAKETGFSKAEQKQLLTMTLAGQKTIAELALAGNVRGVHIVEK